MDDSGYNPNRTDELYALTVEGYIVAHDITCQQEYVALHRCPTSDTPLKLVAQINRAYQGLIELVALSLATGERFSFIFDISNEVYQSWLAAQMGDLYEPLYDGPPRVADPNQRFYAGTS